MKQRYLWSVLLSLMLWGCSSARSEKDVTKEQNMNKAASTTPTPSPTPRSYSKDLNEVRASFNRDKGKVRIVTLLSPT